LLGTIAQHYARKRSYRSYQYGLLGVERDNIKAGDWGKFALNECDAVGLAYANVGVRQQLFLEFKVRCSGF